MFSLGLFIASVVLFVLATVGVPSSPRFNLMSAGLACMALAFLLEGRAP